MPVIASQRTKKKGSKSFRVAVQPRRNGYLVRRSSLVVPPRQGSPPSTAFEPQLPDLPPFPSTDDSVGTPAVLHRHQELNEGPEDALVVSQSLAPRPHTPSPCAPTPPEPRNFIPTRGITVNPLPRRQPVPAPQPVYVPAQKFPYFCPFNDIVDGKWTCPGRMIHSGDDLLSHVLSTHKNHNQESWEKLRHVWDQVDSGLHPDDYTRLNEWMKARLS